MKYITKRELNEILEKASNNKNSRDYVYLLLLIKSGLRVSESINLKPQDINFFGKYLYIVGKGKRIRNVDISSSLVNLLRLYISNNSIKNNDRIFPFTRQNAFTITKKYSNLNPHAFRHSFAIELLRKTKNIRFVQEQLGHKNIKDTQIYLRYMDYDEEKKKLEELFQ